VVYADIFDWPLNASEIKKWEIAGKGKQDVRVIFEKGYYCLQKKTIAIRQEREKISLKKLGKAKKIIEFLKRIPTIEGVFLTGSVAVGNAKKDSDIDLMIVTKPNTLWLTRAAVVAILKFSKKYGNFKDRICPNIFLDANHLEIKEKNLYTAHEVRQVKCLFDRGGVEKEWLFKNSWTKEYLPDVVHEIFAVLSRRGGTAARLKILFITFCLFEPLAFVSQYLYQLPKQTNEKVGWGYAFFHPDQLGQKVEDKFRQRLVKYSR